jgi:hypothetical protein
MSNKEYLMIEYFVEDTILNKINEKLLFEILQEEGLKNPKEKRKIAVFELGDCLIDWS